MHYGSIHGGGEGDRCVGFTLKYRQTKGVQGGLDEISHKGLLYFLSNECLKFP